MNFAMKALATARFDFARSLQPSRIVVALVLASFPPLIMGLAAQGGGIDGFPLIIGVTVMMIGLLALLLWATPIVHQELEGKTWTYLAVRPQGRSSLLVGKYLMSVGWTIAVCEFAMSISTVIVLLTSPGMDVIRMWFVYTFLIVLAAFGYAAIFLLFGVLFHRRSMVLVVAYLLLMEGVVARLPAIINQLTISHHLMALAVKWQTFRIEEIDQEIGEMIGATEPAWQNILMIAMMGVSVMFVTLSIIRNREYITADDN